MRVLQIGGDRSKHGILFPGSPASKRQEAYAQEFGALDIIGFSQKSDGAKAYTLNTLSVYPTDSSSRSRYLFDALRVARRLPRPDVVSAQDPFESGFVGWCIARRLRVPLHIQVHTDFLSPEYARHSLVNRLRVWLAGFVLRRASRVRVVSERIQKSMEKKYRITAPVSVLPIFIDVERFRNAVPDAGLLARFATFKTKLLVVSRLESEKNILLALKAFAKSASQDTCLIIIGEGEERRSLQSVARSLGILERVFFEGSQDPAPYYALVDLVLVTSRYEGYGLVIVEALAAGTPILSTDVGVAREAGAIVTSVEKFPDALGRWFESGPRTGELKNYLYRNFDEYVQAYCGDIIACAESQKR